jgi:hypothetical protein
MPKYRYSGMDAQGRERSGQIEAESRARAMTLIKQQGLFPTSIDEAGAAPAAARAGASRGGGKGAAGGKGGLQTEIRLPSFMRPRVKPSTFRSSRASSPP